jgi:hypothetical protein
VDGIRADQDAGGILGLRGLVTEYEEHIAADFLACGRSIDEIGVTMSWFELRSWLRRPPPDSWYGRTRAAEAAEEAAEAAKPEDQRRVGGKSDALPIDELDEFLGWKSEVS